MPDRGSGASASASGTSGSGASGSGASGAALDCDIEVVGLEGRAAVANGLYRDTGYLQNGHPKYEQCTWVSVGASSQASQRVVAGPARLLYDAGEWIVEVPNDPGKAYAYVEDAAATPDAVLREWLVWYCDESTRIEDGVWLQRGTQLGSVEWPTPFRISRAIAEPGTRQVEPEAVPAEFGGASPLSRTNTRRTIETDESLDALSTEIEGLEERVRHLDLAASQATLGGLMRQLGQLSSTLDETMVQGLTGETPLKDRRKSLRSRVEFQLAKVELEIAAQAPQAARPEPGAQVASAQLGLSRTQTRRTIESNESLDALSTKIEGLEERLQHPERSASQETLSRLQFQLDELEDALSQTTVRGASDESSLRARLGRLSNRVQTARAALDRAVADVVQPAPAESTAEPEFDYEWKELPPHMPVPPGLEYRLALDGGPTYARIAFKWQLQLWSETADAFYRIEVWRRQTIGEVEAALEHTGPSLPQSMQRDWGAVRLGVRGAALPRELSVEQARLFQLYQEKQLEWM